MTTTEEKIEKINKEMARILKAIPNITVPSNNDEDNVFQLRRLILCR